MRTRGILITALAMSLAGLPARAAPPPPVDVRIKEPQPPLRIVDIALNPLSLILLRPSVEVVFSPIEHHSLVLNLHYFWTSTAPVFLYDDQQNPTQLPRQFFQGGGGELGYRYYFGRGGPRGWFVGPSFLLSGITATAQNGTKTDYLNFGFAFDAGHQILIGDRVSIGAGLGVQATFNSKNIPRQQYPATVLTDGRVLPRFLLSIGVAL